jgi:tetratricopeptide (TPR) repeat protein
MRISRRWSRGVLGIALLVMGLSAHLAPGAAASDAVLDAKRKAAAQLLRDGKASDALALLTEVVAVDDKRYGDHLLMARACDKLAETAEATRQYHRVLELLPTAPANAEERAARAEADKKLKQIDPLSGKIDAVVDDYERHLDTLEREAIAGRNMAALERLFRLRGMTWQADKAKDRGYLEVFADTSHGAWQHSGLDVRAGQSYRVRAAGTWQIRGNGGPQSRLTCTASGTDQRKGADFGYRYGALLGQVNGKIFTLGEDAVFSAPASGELLFIESDENDAARATNKGSVQVLIVPQ